MAETAGSFTTKYGDVVLLMFHNIFFHCDQCLGMCVCGGGWGAGNQTGKPGIDEGGFWTVKCVFITSFISNK